MGYIKTLDEREHEVLTATLKWRAKNIAEGKCDYCERPQGEEPPCQFPKRHEGNHWQEDSLMRALVLKELEDRMFKAANQYVNEWVDTLRALKLGSTRPTEEGGDEPLWHAHPCPADCGDSSATSDGRRAHSHTPPSCGHVRSMGSDDHGFPYDPLAHSG